MTIWEKLLLVASIVAALVTICTAVYKYMYKPFHGIIEQWHTFQDKLHNIYIGQLRMIVMSDDMPLVERVAAGYQYVEVEHQNGPVKQKYYVLCEEYKKQQEEQIE